MDFGYSPELRPLFLNPMSVKRSKKTVYDISVAFPPCMFFNCESIDEFYPKLIEIVDGIERLTGLRVFLELPENLHDAQFSSDYLIGTSLELDDSRVLESDPQTAFKNGREYFETLTCPLGTYYFVFFEHKDGSITIPAESPIITREMLHELNLCRAQTLWHNNRIIVKNTFSVDLPYPPLQPDSYFCGTEMYDYAKKFWETSDAIQEIEEKQIEDELGPEGASIDSDIDFDFDMESFEADGGDINDLVDMILSVGRGEMSVDEFLDETGMEIESADCADVPYLEYVLCPST